MRIAGKNINGEPRAKPFSAYVPTFFAKAFKTHSCRPRSFSNLGLRIAPNQGLSRAQRKRSASIQKRVGYDRNNGRPRYSHVRLKTAAHVSLRLAVNNA